MAIRTLREFIKLEAGAGVVLFLSAVVAMIISNSPFKHYYDALFALPLSITLGEFSLSKPLLLWINDGFMAIFFLLVGLEIKRELFEGELSSLAKAFLPALAATGGMVVPAVIYLYLNWGDSVAMQGWAIPVATDIAFSLGILALLRSHVPVSLKIFLTALAIFDDIGAIVIIAVFYTREIAGQLLLFAGGLLFVLLLFNRLNIKHFAAYFIVGIAMWVCVLESGVHATLAGILLAFAIPLRDRNNPKVSPLRDLEHKLHPWVAYGVLPIFAFANAGVTLRGMSWSQVVGPIPLGIMLGLFVGKQIGIWASSMLGVKIGAARMPIEATSAGIYGTGLVAGVGFTMSLFIGTLAFGTLGGTYAAQVRLGVMIGSLLSGLCGYLVLRFAYAKR